MIDLETLDTTPSCVILTIGIVIFDPKQNGIIDLLDIRPTMEDQVALGRTISDGTMQWWSNQSAEAQEEAFGEKNRMSFADSMEVLSRYCWNHPYVWSHGAGFDVVAIENALTCLKMNIPWQYYNVRDTRTLFDITKVSLKDGGHVTSHRASDDAKFQALAVQRAYKILMDAGVVK